ncbi:MAG: hypothetical protein KDJ38_02680 [Gammaproteobacteria bacterium]|nr:hypothetical protein [Gammaproteobacteria bacterium]
MKIRVLLSAVIAFLSAGAAHAEYLGLPYGRTANTETHSPMTLEGGIQLGDLDNFIARLSLNLNPKLSIYGDLGLTDMDYGHGYGSESGLNIGGGFVYGLGELAPEIDFGVLGSIHRVSTDDFDWTGLAVRGVASGDLPIQEVAASWYASAGLEYLSVSVDNCRGCDADDTELALGGGIIYPIGPGEAFGGLDLVDELTIGGGYRINLK